MKWLLFVLLAPTVLACVVPQNGMVIDYSVQFCSDVYYFNQGISISGDNILVDCDGAVLKSWTGGKGISIEHSSNITVTGCRLVSYDKGFYVRNSTKVFLEDNHLVKNQVGARFVVVSDSATFNHDVSLIQPFEILESDHNILSLSNKFVSGDFCSENFCNEHRNAVELFLQPKTTPVQMGDWLLEHLGVKTAERLKNWVFGSFV